MASDLMRLAGINSGYDSEAMIQEMMSGYQTKIDNQNKKLTKLKWKQDAYRDVITKLTDFQDKYFDILKKDKYLMSPSTFSKFKTKVTAKGGDEAKGTVAVTTTSNSKVGSHEIEVLQTATKAKMTGARINPTGFSLDLTKAKEANYEIGSDAEGYAIRKYDFALDVKVGDVTKTVEFKFDIKAAEMSDFGKKLRDALNIQLADAFGKITIPSGDPDVPDTEQFFLQASWPEGSNTLNFKVGGNAAVSITEKTGNFGLAKPQYTHSISTQSCITGKNTVAIALGGTTQSVSFEGVSATYFDSRAEKGNSDVLEEYNELKEAAFRKQYHLGPSASIDKAQFNAYAYSSTQAAKDKNAEALLDAANSAFAGKGITFTISDKGIMSANKGFIPEQFTITSVEGGTLGLTKGNATNRISDNATLSEMGMVHAYDGLNINGKDIEVKSDMTVKEFLDKVNKSGAGVTMSYSTVENRFIVESNDMGNGGDFKIKFNDFVKELGLTKEAGAEIAEGKNARFKLDGVEIYHNANSYEFDGSKFDFTDAVEGETYKVGITKNYDDVKQTIKDFVKDYNQLIDDVYGHIGQAPVRDNKNNTYEPLSDAEKEEMDEKEIEKWETAAKKGVIYNDPTISSIMSQIRTTLYNSVTTEDGKKFGIFNMGIATIPYDYASHGKLEIDEDKFDAAFDANPDAIAKLFTDADTGIMKKIDTIIDNAASSTTSDSGAIRGSLVRKAGLEKGASAKNNEIFRQMEQINKRIQTLQDRYDSKEEYWWSVFTNLEKMMGEFNSQSNYMASYLGGGMM